MRTSQFAAWVVAAAVYVGEFWAADRCLRPRPEAAPQQQSSSTTPVAKAAMTARRASWKCSPAMAKSARPAASFRQICDERARRDGLRCLPPGNHRQRLAAPDRQGVKKAECAQCHLDLWEATKKQGRRETPPRHRCGKRRRHKQSFHAKPDKDDPTKLMAICSDCHNVHT